MTPGTAQSMFARYPSLAGQTAFVSGGATGLGASFVRELAQQDVRVAFVDIDRDAGERLRDELVHAGAPDAWFGECDVRNVSALQSAIRDAAAALGPVTILVNNAANDTRDTVMDMDVALWDDRMAVNVRHHFFATQAVVPMMREAGHGSVINLGSISAHIDLMDLPGYITAKAGIEGLTRTLAREFGPDGIRVNCIIPGWIMTERQLADWITPDAEASIERNQCLPQRLYPDDVARLMLWLAAEDSRSCTAQKWIVDGGLDVKADQLTEPVAFHGEGPFWDDAHERLLLVDMLAGAVLSLDDDGVHRHPVGSVAAVIRARAGGGYVAALERGFALLDESLTVRDVLPQVFDNAAIRMNDGGCDPQGRFYCGTMAYAETPGAGTLYRLDPDRRVSTVLEGVTISNGLQWSADGSRVFYNDTPTGSIDVFDFDGDTGRFSARRPLVALGEGLNPDGMAIDTEDGVWIALWGGSAVHRYDSSGRLSEVIDLPVSHVTACAFGGAGRSTLYITTSRLGLEAGAEPEAGAVFTARTGITGARPFAWAG